MLNVAAARRASELDQKDTSRQRRRRLTRNAAARTVNYFAALYGNLTTAHVRLIVQRRNHAEQSGRRRLSLGVLPGVQKRQALAAIRLKDVE